MPTHKLTLAVTGMGTGTHLLFHVERDEIQHMAQTWANGIKSMSKQEPDKNPDPAYQAFATLWDMLLNHEGPVTPLQEAAAAYLFTTSSGWEPHCICCPLAFWASKRLHCLASLSSRHMGQ